MNLRFPTSSSQKILLFAFLIGCEPTDKWAEGEFLDYGNIDDASNDSSSEFNEEDQNHCNFIFLLEHGYVGANHYSHLWKFKPDQGKLIDVGDLNCPFNVGNDYLIAMTADQNGILWFVSNSEQLYWLNPNVMVNMFAL